jgi:hypothetical protein
MASVMLLLVMLAAVRLPIMDIVVLSCADIVDMIGESTTAVASPQAVTIINTNNICEFIR